MDSFIARQAIFDRDLKVWAYELLFRSGDAKKYDGENAEAATASVVANGFFDSGFEKLLQGAKASVNFDEALLLGDLGSTLPLPPGTMIEVLPTVTPRQEVIEACRRLRMKGYVIALDRYDGDPALEALLEVADVVKIDVLEVEAARAKAILGRLRTRGTRTVAEKLETRPAYEQARTAGFDYFQGFFFAEPALISSSQIPAATHSALRLMREMQAPDVDFDRVEELIKCEVGLSHRLLQYLNSPIFTFTAPVASIRQALVMLGEIEIRRWVTLASFSRLGSGKPLELLKHSMVRGRFCEMAGREIGLPPGVDAFLMGVFSLLPALLDRSMATLLSELALAPELAAPLLGTAPKDSRLAGLLRLVRAWEAGDWGTVRTLTEAFAISTAAVGQAYIEAVGWADHAASDGSTADSKPPAAHPPVAPVAIPARTIPNRHAYR